MKKIHLLILSALLALAAVACDLSKTENAPPTAPPTPAAPGNDSVVPDGECAAEGPCVTSYSVTLDGGETVSWVFTGAQPPTSDIQAGDVKWKAPGTYRWTSSVCNSALCTKAGGEVTFTESEAAVKATGG